MFPLVLYVLAEWINDRVPCRSDGRRRDAHMALVAVLRLPVPEEVRSHDALDVAVGDGRFVVHVLEYRKLVQRAQNITN